MGCDHAPFSNLFQEKREERTEGKKHVVQVAPYFFIPSRYFLSREGSPREVKLLHQNNERKKEKGTEFVFHFSQFRGGKRKTTRDAPLPPYGCLLASPIVVTGAHDLLGSSAAYPRSNGQRAGVGHLISSVLGAAAAISVHRSPQQHHARSPRLRASPFPVLWSRRSGMIATQFGTAQRSRSAPTTRSSVQPKSFRTVCDACARDSFLEYCIGAPCGLHVYSTSIQTHVHCNNSISSVRMPACPLDSYSISARTRTPSDSMLERYVSIVCLDACVACLCARVCDAGVRRRRRAAACDGMRRRACLRCVCARRTATPAAGCATCLRRHPSSRVQDMLGQRRAQSKLLCARTRPCMSYAGRCAPPTACLFARRIHRHERSRCHRLYRHRHARCACHRTAGCCVAILSH
jgi:hypothetical protein